LIALSQDENEMGRFIRDQGSLDKTKAGKMMIAVGKAQSFAAQQRFVNENDGVLSYFFFYSFLFNIKCF